MDREIFYDLLSSYTNDFDKNWIKEDYKWKVVKTFQEWDSNAKDFYGMFKYVTKDAGNLLTSTANYPVDDILKLIQKDSNTIKNAFKELFDLENDVLDCARTFRDILIEQNKKYGFKPRAGNYVRTIATLLAFRYPEQYSIFKLDIAKTFSELTNIGIDFYRDELLSIIKYKNMVRDIIAYIPQDHPIFIKYRNKLKSNINEYYQDSDYFMLAQDIIYYASVYYKKKTIEEKEYTFIGYETITFNKDNVNKKVSLKASKSDYLNSMKRNTRTGRLGEQFVLEQERLKLREAGIDKTPEWVSVNRGDGLGYDILSYDSRGNEIYIEVKTTTGHIDSTFHITTNEYILSRKYPNKYRLYRVYEFKDNQGKIAVIKGSLKELCIKPTGFVVSGKNLFYTNQ